MLWDKAELRFARAKVRQLKWTKTRIFVRNAALAFISRFVLGRCGSYFVKVYSITFILVISYDTLLGAGKWWLVCMPPQTKSTDVLNAALIWILAKFSHLFTLFDFFPLCADHFLSQVREARWTRGCLVSLFGVGKISAEAIALFLAFIVDDNIVQLSPQRGQGWTNDLSLLSDPESFFLLSI